MERLTKRNFGRSSNPSKFYSVLWRLPLSSSVVENIYFRALLLVMFRAARPDTAVSVRRAGARLRRLSHACGGLKVALLEARIGLVMDDMESHIQERHRLPSHLHGLVDQLT
jgi:hypothetical protein